ncbi:hypothetical protein ACVBGC_34760 [Burkholderia stagnalis]
MVNSQSLPKSLSQVSPVFTLLLVPIQGYILHLSGSTALAVFGSMLATGLHMFHIGRNYYQRSKCDAQRHEEDEDRLTTWNFLADGSTICRVIPKPHISMLALYPNTALLFGLLHWLLDFVWPGNFLFSSRWLDLTFDAFCLICWYWLSFMFLAACELHVNHEYMAIGRIWFLVRSRSRHDLRNVISFSVQQDKSGVVISLRRFDESSSRVRLNTTDMVTIRHFTDCLARYKPCMIEKTE